MSADRLEVWKTWKLYIDGAFVRSESGRTLPVADTGDTPPAQVCRASRKDARDAVRAARAAFPGWSGRTAANRGQILYRIAEMLEGRAADMAELLARGSSRPKRARAEVDAAIDRWVWYAGWCDKLPHVLGGAVPVAGPFFTFSIPEPTGVIALASPLDPPLLGLTSRLAPVLAGANTAVVVADGYSLPALAFAEVLATSDLPGGVVNLLSGSLAEVIPVLAAHRDVDGLDLGSFNGDDAVEAERAAADNVKRVTRAPQHVDWFDEGAQTPYMISAFLEVKTVWHPAGF